MKTLLPIESAITDSPWPEIVGDDVKETLRLNSLAADLSAEHIYDLVVIGAGIAGLSAAKAAANQGARVVVLERAPVLGAGASGRNAGILGAGVNMPLVHTPDDHPAMALWRKTSLLLPELYGLASDQSNFLIANNVGALSISKCETATKRLIKEAKERIRCGLRADMVSVAEIADLTTDHLDLSGVQTALYLPDEGRINPLTLLAFLAREARQAGCVLYGGAEVIGRNSINARSKWRLRTTCNIDILASSIIYATGPLVHPNRRIYAISYRFDLPEKFPLFWDSAPFTYYDYRGGEGFFTVTGGKYGVAYQDTNDQRHHESMMEAAQIWLPDLRKVHPSHMWGVNLDVTAEMVPHLSEISEKPCAMSIDGLGALGVLPGMVLGRECGEKVASKVAQE